MKRIFYFIILNIYISSLFSSDYKVLDIALQKIDYDENKFRYQTKMSILGDKPSYTIYSFNPVKTPKVELLEIDGRKPDKSDINKFLKNMNRDDSRGINTLLGKKYTFIEEKNGLSKYSYITEESLIPKKESKMLGEVLVDLNSESIKKITLYTKKEIDITVGVKLQEFLMVFVFEDYDDEFTIVKELNMSMKGKAFFKEFSQSTKSSLYAYEIIN